MIRWIMYGVLFLLAYQVFRKFISSNFGNPGGSDKKQERFRNSGGKSNVVEDVDYEEVD